MISRGTCSEVLWIMKVTVEVTVPWNCKLAPLQGHLMRGGPVISQWWQWEVHLGGRKGKVPSRKLHVPCLAAEEGKKSRYWWLDFSGADAGLRTIPVLYLDTPRCKCANLWLQGISWLLQEPAFPCVVSLSWLHGCFVPSACIWSGGDLVSSCVARCEPSASSADLSNATHEPALPVCALFLLSQLVTGALFHPFSLLCWWNALWGGWCSWRSCVLVRPCRKVGCKLVSTWSPYRKCWLSSEWKSHWQLHLAASRLVALDVPSHRGSWVWYCSCWLQGTELSEKTLLLGCGAAEHEGCDWRRDWFSKSPPAFPNVPDGLITNITFPN